MQALQACHPAPEDLTPRRKRQDLGEYLPQGFEEFWSAQASPFADYDFYGVTILDTTSLLDEQAATRFAKRVWRAFDEGSLSAQPSSPFVDPALFEDRIRRLSIPEETKAEWTRENLDAQIEFLSFFSALDEEDQRFFRELEALHARLAEEFAAHEKRAVVQESSHLNFSTPRTSVQLPFHIDHGIVACGTNMYGDGTRFARIPAFPSLSFEEQQERIRYAQDFVSLDALHTACFRLNRQPWGEDSLGVAHRGSNSYRERANLFSFFVPVLATTPCAAPASN